jgi:pimeloyl-ACP methyl ester carboxylesterase
VAPLTMTSERVGVARRRGSAWAGNQSWRTAVAPTATTLGGGCWPGHRSPSGGWTWLGVSTAVLEGGQGPPVVLLHGQGGWAGMWLPNIAELVRTHRVVAPDLPVLGASQVPDGPPAAARVLAWLDALIQPTCPVPPALVGVSLGASIAARFAIAHPDQLSRLVLIGAGSLGRFRPAPGVALAMIRFIAPAPGLWYLGLRWLRRRCSSILLGFPDDTAWVADAVRPIWTSDRALSGHLTETTPIGKSRPSMKCRCTSPARAETRWQANIVANQPTGAKRRLRAFASRDLMSQAN